MIAKTLRSLVNVLGFHSTDEGAISSRQQTASHRSRKKNDNRWRPQVEALEERFVLTGDVFTSPTGVFNGSTLAQLAVGEPVNLYSSPELNIGTQGTNLFANGTLNYAGGSTQYSVQNNQIGISGTYNSGTGTNLAYSWLGNVLGLTATQDFGGGSRMEMATSSISGFTTATSLRPVR